MKKLAGGGFLFFEEKGRVYDVLVTESGAAVLFRALVAAVERAPSKTGKSPRLPIVADNQQNLNCQ